MRYRACGARARIDERQCRAGRNMLCQYNLAEEDAMTTKLDAGSWPSFMVQMPDNWLESYKSLASASQAMMQRWLANRTEQTQHTLDTVTKMTACKSPAEAAEIQQRWLRETVERLTAEVKEYQEQVTALSQQGLSTLSQASPGAPSRSHPKAA
jgi:hypothetical protein